MMWATISNRFVLGIMVAIAGYNLKVFVWYRGMKIGFLVFLLMALGALMGTDPEMAQ